ncbi:MAG TPA: hypothetical protein VJ756_07680 [Terriglobales bacterium]|nr:hypothetical protein [Terriglobales bacterium]
MYFHTIKIAAINIRKIHGLTRPYVEIASVKDAAAAIHGDA